MTSLGWYIASAVAFLVALACFVFTSYRLSRWRRTSGRILSITKEWQSDSEGMSLMHAPIVEFKTIEDERTISFQDSVWTSPGWLSPGDAVIIYYDPAEPTRATIAGWRPYFVTMASTAGAIILLIIALSHP
jgi:hypothetical protein